MATPTPIARDELTFVVYPDEDTAFLLAHCIELDFVGQGDTRDEAVQDLRDCIDAFLEDYAEHPDEWGLQPAPAEVLALPDRKPLW